MYQVVFALDGADLSLVEAERSGSEGKTKSGRRATMFKFVNQQDSSGDGTESLSPVIPEDVIWFKFNFLPPGGQMHIVDVVCVNKQLEAVS